MACVSKIGSLYELVTNRDEYEGTEPYMRRGRRSRYY